MALMAGQVAVAVVLLSAGALLLVAHLYTGVTVSSFGAAMVAALVLGLLLTSFGTIDIGDPSKIPLPVDPDIAQTNVLVQLAMLAAPTTQFVMLAQAILYRGAGFGIVWPQFVALAVIGSALFALALARFRRSLATMA